MEDIFIDMRKQGVTLSKYFMDKDFISLEVLLAEMEELIDEVEHWKDKYKDLENDIEENYTLRPFDPYTEYGVSRDDF
jgi:hypothetical protein